MSLFAPRRIADDADGGGVTFIKCESRQAADDGLQLVMIGRVIGSEWNQSAQSAVSLGQIAH
jgi:hypothetical protein